jgi:hypothetical protein
MNPPRTLLRHRGHEEARVGMVELFFDLVFVFAVTQLSHALLAHLNAISSASVHQASRWSFDARPPAIPARRSPRWSGAGVR